METRLLIERMHGQVVVGPPGSGKSSYCKAVQDYLRGKTKNINSLKKIPLFKIIKLFLSELKIWAGMWK